jgi:hypothetical protein
MMKYFRTLSARHAVAVLTAVAALACQSGPALAAPASPVQHPVVQPPVVQHPAGLEAQSIRVTEVVGTVEVREASSDVWRVLKTGDTLKPSDVIRTGEDGSARIEFDGKIRMQVLNASELTIEEARRDNEKTRQTLLRLDIGKIKAEVDKLGPDSSFKIMTPTAVSSVRGTTFYLSVIRFAQGLAGILTDLYVDEGRVDFASVEDQVNALFVEAFHTSSISGDGEKTEPKELTPEEREALIKAFADAFKSLGGNPQTGVETGGLPGGPGGALPPGGADAGRDRLERLIRELVNLRDENGGIDDEDGIFEDLDALLLLSLKLTAQLLSEGLDLSGDFDYDQVSNGFDLGIVSEERGQDLNEALNATDPAGVIRAIADLKAIRDAEKAQLRDALDSILDDQERRRVDADQEREFDAQTGKVFTDVHGNRVRTDQYIYHEPGSDLVRMVSLTLRTGEYQNGVTSFTFATRFNEDLPEGTVLKELPWNAYLNVVTAEDFRDRSAQEESAGGLLGSLLPSPRYDQYIVYGTGAAPALYPVEFEAEFQNPAMDRVTFTEAYTDPYGASFLNDENERVGRSVQGRERNGVSIREDGGVSIDRTTRRLLGVDITTTRINGGLPVVTLGDTGDDGAQTSGLELEDLTAPDAVAGSADANEHPAFFTEEFTDQRLVFSRGRLRLVRTDYALTGIFLPIDNDGALIDAPGFEVRGIRDLVQPNQAAGLNGRYNLETILSFGRRTNGGTAFVEDFRIDAIITPEIFAPYRSNSGEDEDELFPDRLVSEK